MPHRGRNNGPRNPLEVGLDLYHSIHSTEDGHDGYTLTHLEKTVYINWIRNGPLETTGYLGYLHIQYSHVTMNRNQLTRQATGIHYNAA